jgi:hypothetical protein
MEEKQLCRKSSSISLFPRLQFSLKKYFEMCGECRVLKPQQAKGWGVPFLDGIKMRIRQM